MNEGWKCPECGKVNAPWVQACDHVKVVAYPLYVLPQQPDVVTTTPTVPGEFPPNWDGRLSVTCQAGKAN